MPWEQRGGKKYYYRSRREGDKVVKDYFGCGAAARSAAQADEEKRKHRQEEKLLIEEETTHLQPAEQSTEDLDRLSRLLMEADLLISGYWRPDRSVWRKRHADKQHPTESE